jgi:membrane fusion protein (multidrug efflux system)
MQAEFERVKKLFDQSLISEKEFTDARFEVRQLQLSLDEAERQLEFTEIKAPIAGTVTKRMIRIGDLINNNAELFQIINFDSIVAFVAVPDKNLAQLRIDQPVRITSTARPGEVFAGFIKRISPIVEARTGMVKVTVGVRKTPLLRPGMYIEAEIVLATNNDAVLITRRAIVYDGDQMYVYRLKNNRRVERIRLIPRMMDKLNIEPMSGFSVGDQIVVAGQTGLKDNALVRLPGDPETGVDDASEPVTAEKPKDTGKAKTAAHSS